MPTSNGPPNGARSTALALSSFSDTTPVVIDAADAPLALTVDDVLRYIAPGAPRPEALTFLLTCKAMRLNPLIREAFLVPAKDKWATVVAKSGYTKAAQRHESYDGHDAGIVGQPYDPSKVRPNAPPPFIGPPVDFEGTLLPDGYLLVGGWGKAWRKGVSRPITSRVSMKEFAKTSRSGMGTWETMPCTMIRKVALVAALREAFSLSGYDEAEMPVAQPPEPAARTFTATVVTPVQDAPAGADAFAGYSFRPAPVSPIGSIAHEPAAAPVPAAERATREQVARLKDLFARAGASPDQVVFALNRRNVDRAEDLSAVDAQTMITKLEKKLDAANGPDELAARIATSSAASEHGPNASPETIAEVARQNGEDPTEHRWCEVCEQRQKYTTSGWVCANGHGGAPSLMTDPAIANVPSLDDPRAPDVDADGFDWATGTTPAERGESGAAVLTETIPALNRKLAKKRDKAASEQADEAADMPSAAPRIA